MWPFSTIRDLRLELEQAEAGAETLRGIINRQDADIGRLREELQAVRADALEKANKVQSMSGSLMASEHTRRSLAAERDEAVLRARNVDHKLAVAKEVLEHALIRDHKTGRMRKFSETDLWTIDPTHALAPVAVSFEKRNA